MKRSKFSKKPHRLFLISPLLLIWIGTILIDIERSDTQEVGNLLERSDKIKAGYEWEKTQNIYNNQVMVLKSNPENITAKLKLVELFIKEARVTGEHGHYYPAALNLVNETIENPKVSQEEKFTSLTLKAGILLSLHEFQNAEVVAKEAMSLNTYNAQIYGVLVDCYVELGEYKEAVKMADKMISIRPDLRSYARVSYLREIHGQPYEAEQALHMAISAGYPGEEETAWTMLTLAELLCKYDKIEQAEMVYRSILDQRPNYPFAIAGLAEIEYDRGNLKQTESLLNESIAIIPEVGFYISLAKLYKSQGREAEYNAYMEEILAMLRDDEQAGHNMNLEYADIYLNLEKDLQKALKYVDIEFQKRPKNIDVQKMMSSIYLAQNEYSKAKSHLANAMRTGSKSPDLLAIDAKLN